MKIIKFMKSNYGIGILITLLFVLLDQVTKAIAYHYQDILRFDNVIVIKNLFELSYTQNYAASFGFLGDSAYKEIIFIMITVFALGMFAYFFKDVDFKSKKIYSFSIVLFISGTLGNAIDRLFRGFVIDFLHFPFFDFLVYVNLSNFDNNIADILLFIAIAFFAIEIFILDILRKKKEKSNDVSNN